MQARMKKVQDSTCW